MMKHKGQTLQKKLQMSESIPVYVILALSGGCMDAYSYLYRDMVFANAQTGNMLLFGVHLAERNIPEALKYLWPILAFTLGIMLADYIRIKIQNGHIHWRQIILVIEILVLFSVCWLPQAYNGLANALISLACGLQVESFRSVEGNSIATTMCIGNLRSGTYNLDKYIQTRQPEYLSEAAVYYGIILFFVIGAIIESALLKTFSEKALFFSVGMLLVACLLMFKQPQEENV